MFNFNELYACVYILHVLERSVYLGGTIIGETDIYMHEFKIT